jgi:pimeloyl-ACP methyl ester carboxylesterase
LVRREYFLPRGGEKIFVKVEGDGFPLLFGHGLTFSHTMWEKQAEFFRKEYQVVRWDFRGHGKTIGGKTPFTLKDLAEDVVAIMKDLRISQCVYVGFSMGGMVGVRLLAEYRSFFSGMVFIGTTADAELPDRRDLYLEINERTKGKDPDPATVDFVLSLMFSERFREEEKESVEPFRQQLFRKNDDGIYHATRAVLTREDFNEKISGIEVPALILYGENDLAVPPEQSLHLQKALPNSTVVSFPECGHMSPVEKWEEVNKEIKGFLRRIGL